MSIHESNSAPTRQASQQWQQADWLPTWPPDWPEIAESIRETLASGNWGRYQGPRCRELKRRVSEMVHAEHCRLVCSGSAGVELALRASGINSGAGVVLCGYDYPGNLRAVELVGARPILADADEDRFSVSPEALQSLASDAAGAVIVSHLYGVPARIAEIRGLCDDRGWVLIEDACQVPGMLIQKRPAGRWGNVGVFSFGGSKPLTCGNGGAVVTSDAAIASRWNRWLDRPSDAMPMSELQAAALLPQLDHLDKCNRIRAQTLLTLRSEVDWVAAMASDVQPDPKSTIYKWAVCTEHRDRIIGQIRTMGIPAGEGYRSMHRSSDRRCDKLGSLERCRQLGSQLCLIDHTALLAQGESRRKLVEAFAGLVV